MNKEKILLSFIFALSLVSSSTVLASNSSSTSSALNANPKSSATVESKTQSEQSSAIGIDFHVGPSVSTLGGDFDSTAFSSKLGISFGVGYDLPLSSMFSLHPELNYVQKGISYRIPSPNLTASTSIHLNYLEVPLLLKAQLPLPVEGFHPYLVAGPIVGYTLTQSAGVVIPTAINSPIGLGSPGSIKSWDYGIQLGAGADIPTNSVNAILVDLRYDLGLANLNDTGSGGSVQNRAMTLALGYRL